MLPLYRGTRLEIVILLFLLHVLVPVPDFVLVFHVRVIDLPALVLVLVLPSQRPPKPPSLPIRTPVTTPTPTFPNLKAPRNYQW